jgi:hypothetical protein
MLSGLHKISFSEYMAIDACSSHRLGLLSKSPAHLKHEINTPREETQALKIGKAIHAAILEPSEFVNHFVQMPKLDARTKEGKAKRDDFLAIHSRSTILSEDEYRQVMNIGVAVRSHKIVSNLLNTTTHTEISGFFKDKETGIECKMRADAICAKHGLIWDIKSTDDASPTSFESSIFKFGYHRQAAFYLNGANALGLNIKHFLIVAAEKTAPFACAVYRLSDEAIELGREENAVLITKYARCVEANEWPSYPEIIKDVGLPAYAKKQIERRINGN